MLLPETILHDLHYAIRLLHRNTASTVVSIVALALGIGVNTTVFTAYKAMVKRPVEAVHSAEMVNIALIRDSGRASANFSYPDYEAYRDSARSFSGLIAFRVAHMMLSTMGGMMGQRTAAAGSGMAKAGLLPSGGDRHVEFATAYVVSDNYFEVLGVPLLRGRTLRSQNSERAASPAVLISENYWRTRFDSDPEILGKTVRLNGLPVAIIGITPHDFVGTLVAAPCFWVPASTEPLLNGEPNWLQQRDNERYRIFGRLAAGVSSGQAQAEVTAIANRERALHDRRSQSARSVKAIIWPGSPFPLPLGQYGGLKLTILLIMAAALTVLAVACANVGGLQLARARSRESELHMRVSLGASRSRIIRQLLTESAVQGLLAGSVALVVSWMFLKALVALALKALPADMGAFVFDVAPDLQVFGYALTISAAAAMASGIAPAFESSRAALSCAIRSGTLSARSRRLQDGLVAVQVAFSLTLMIAGGMLIESSIRSLKMPTGYDTKKVASIDVRFAPAARYTPARKMAFLNELRRRLSALPGVVEISAARPPVDNFFRTAAVPLESITSAGENKTSTVAYTYVEANYFETLGIPIRLGRGFDAHGGQAELCVIISESAAQQMWPGENPLGRRLRLGAVDERFHDRRDPPQTGATYQVIGVSRDKRGSEFDGSDSKEIYLPLSKDEIADRPMLVRAKSDAAEIVKEIDSVTSKMDPNVLATSTTLDQMLRVSAPFITSSLAAAVASMLGLFGLLLASMGIYSTVSYIVVLRTREVGIRMAIGAQKRDVLMLIVRESARPVLAGLVCGLFLAVGGCYLLRGVLYGLTAMNAAAFLGIPLLFLIITLVAIYPPTRRAMQVDPMVALRYE